QGIIPVFTCMKTVSHRAHGEHREVINSSVPSVRSVAIYPYENHENRCEKGEPRIGSPSIVFFIESVSVVLSLSGRQPGPCHRGQERRPLRHHLAVIVENIFFHIAVAKPRIELIVLHLLISAPGIPSIHLHSVYREQRSCSVTPRGAMYEDRPVSIVIDQLQKAVRFSFRRRAL